MWVKMEKERYGLLPRFLESDIDSIFNEINRWSTEYGNDPSTARKSVLEDIGWLKEHKGWLGNSVEAAVSSVLGSYGDILTHDAWISVETFLFKGILVILQGINYKLAEKE